MRTTMRTMAGLAALVLVVAACNDSPGDGFEQLIESETGEDVEIDFGDDGGFSLETEDGSFTVDEDGNFIAVGEDGEVITGDVDVEDGSINIESDEGDATVQIEGDGEDGSIEITGDDGEVSFESGQGIPDEWPADVPQPTGLDVLSGATFNDGTEVGVTVVGTVGGDLQMWVDDYAVMLTAAGLPQSGSFSSGGAISSFHENDVWIVTATGQPDPSSGANQVSVSVISNSNG